MISQEKVNDAIKMIASVIEGLKNAECSEVTYESIPILEEALAKLTESST